MEKKNSCIRFSLILSAFFLFLILHTFALPAGAQYQKKEFSLSLSGGYAHSESYGGLSDLKAELQLGMSSSLRTALAIGYMSTSGEMHGRGGGRSRMGGMMTGSMMGAERGFIGFSQNLKVVPLTLSFYYMLPVSRRANAFMTGGAGYYWSRFRDVSTQEKSAFGFHAGLGFELKLSERVGVVAEGLYRFVKFRGFRSELRPGFFKAESGEIREGYWHFHHDENEYRFHGMDEAWEQMMTDTGPFDINLSGVSLRAGLRFSF